MDYIGLIIVGMIVLGVILVIGMALEDKYNKGYRDGYHACYKNTETGMREPKDD